MLNLCWLTSYGYAEMIPTESTTQVQVETDRQRILDLLNRQEVVDELEKYSISKVEAMARINSLTDEEVTVIAGKLDELQAGGTTGNEVLVMLMYIILWPFILVANTVVCMCVFGIAKLFKGSDADQNLFANCMQLSFFWADTSGAYEGRYDEVDCDPGMESCPGI